MWSYFYCTNFCLLHKSIDFNPLLPRLSVHIKRDFYINTSLLFQQNCFYKKVPTPNHYKSGRGAQKEAGAREPSALQVWRGACICCRSRRGFSPRWPASEERKAIIIICHDDKRTHVPWGMLLTTMWDLPLSKLRWITLVFPSNKGRAFLASEHVIEMITFPFRSCPAGFPNASWNQLRQLKRIAYHTDSFRDVLIKLKVWDGPARLQ